MPLNNIAVPNYVAYNQPQSITGVAPSIVSIPDLSTMQTAGYGLPSVGRTNNLFGIEGLGANIDTLKGVGAGLQTLAGLWSSFQAMNMAKKQLSFARNTANANLANQTQAYNTSIADRARARGAFEGQSQAQVSDYIAQNSLAKRTI